MYRNTDNGLKNNLPNSVSAYHLLPNNSYIFHLNINVTDTVKTVKGTAVSAKHFQSVYSTYSTVNRT